MYTATNRGLVLSFMGCLILLDESGQRTGYMHRNVFLERDSCLADGLGWLKVELSVLVNVHTYLLFLSRSRFISISISISSSLSPRDHPRKASVSSPACCSLTPPPPPRPAQTPTSVPPFDRLFGFLDDSIPDSRLDLPLLPSRTWCRPTSVFVCQAG